MSVHVQHFDFCMFHLTPQQTVNPKPKTQHTLHWAGGVPKALEAAPRSAPTVPGARRVRIFEDEGLGLQ